MNKQKLHKYQIMVGLPREASQTGVAWVQCLGPVVLYLEIEKVWTF